MTLEEIRKAQRGETLWDELVKGLHLRALPEGKVFYLYYRTKSGHQRKPKIGRLGDITLADARRLARILLDQVAVGRDPKAEWDGKRAEETVSELFEECFKAHWATERYQKSGWAYEAKRLFSKRIQPTFGSLRLSEVTAVKVRQWHEKLAGTPTTANRSLSVLAKLFSFAEEKELRPQHTNPCNLVKAHPEHSRDRFATEAEISAIATGLQKYERQFPSGVAFLYLLIFTGSRPRAIERATWDQLEEFELDGRTFGVLSFEGKSTAKTGKFEKVILPPQAMRALKRLPRIEGYTITGMKMPRKLWNKIRDEAGCPDLWARDWRRTYATVGMSNGVNMSTIGELLNHQTTETTKVYAKVVDTRRVEAATLIANKMEGLLQAKQPKRASS